MEIIRADNCEPYITKDGSEIKELLHPAFTQVANLSLAEARVLPGGVTSSHRHPLAEEIYYVLSGEGIIYIDEKEAAVSSGNAVYIPSGHKHYIRNTADEDLVFLCICSPAYSHDDTEME